jgi:hypothetical protein
VAHPHRHRRDRAAQSAAVKAPVVNTYELFAFCSTVERPRQWVPQAASSEGPIREPAQKDVGPVAYRCPQSTASQP